VVGFTTGSRGKVPGKTCAKRIRNNNNNNNNNNVLEEVAQITKIYIYLKYITATFPYIIYNTLSSSENGEYFIQDGRKCMFNKNSLKMNKK
jgi:hypothetical protein